MSSASLIEKRSMKKSHSRNIETSSTSITSAPPTSDSKHNDRRTKDKMMRSRQRESLPDINTRKGNRSIRASNFELSSSANDFDHQKTIPNKVIKPKIDPPTANKTLEKDDKIMELLKADFMQQKKNTLASKKNTMKLKDSE